MNYPILAQDPVPTRLKLLWRDVESGKLTKSDFADQQESLLESYKEIWADALKLPGEQNLTHSLCLEIAQLTGCKDVDLVEKRCRKAMHAMKEEWDQKVQLDNEKSIEHYYDQSEEYAYELMWWHTLEEDTSPLAYVCALHLALKQGCSSAMDFGAGPGTGSLLFASHGIDVTLADISSTLLDFSRRRLKARNIPAAFIDLKVEAPPKDAYDFITAMDVFEHIAEPEHTAEMLADCLRPGGILFGRFSSEDDPERPSHIARDFQPMFDRLNVLGFTEIWRDEWLWGHQAFQKAQ